MATEIRRNNWSRFLKRFNATNQFRTVSVRITRSRGDHVPVAEATPLIGVGIKKKGRLIDGLAVFTGQLDPERLAEPALLILQPDQVMIEKDDQGVEVCMRVSSKDGSVAEIMLSGASQTEPLVQRVAYSLFERRGASVGNDLGDWFEAESRIRRLAGEFV